ncbi:hypothetical protein ASPWEDRAFT_23715 [Aspergillus wentii DTO 134E9]|uniref:Uncharacterized protein n=1 Tax=Aspergillus wentii DTO 134E9 TaxID=1073089 RepID=A0A1L9S3A6_ASPWE|nr:uncharacterized protein ASPWEDRAFT_23715 [Aspergillus wentii DTO 134E9]KAI9929987.1 hypothetical protein MW887_011797 [Aspergillus wentii]OJJ41641.1 hypothetical protein ASPWEDRAFT_23715 [Aspergillus wentii DTO 134E9]
MFRRKRSSSHHQPLSTSSSQSAQSAATHAFLKSQPSSSSLSSAAAATALRSLTPTPQPVENVQTKRMVQRRASVTSQTSFTPSLRSNSRNGLRRINSSSSMSNRSFRDPSPRRPATSSGPVGAVDVAPPLPSIPPEYAGRKPQTRRSVSLDPPMRSTPSPRRTQNRGISVDPGVRASTGQAYSGRLNSLTTVPELDKDLERSGSRNSINFSYPMGARPSPPPSPYNKRDGSAGASLAQLSPAEISNIQNQPLKKPTNKNSKGASPQTPEKGHTVGTAVAAAQAAIVPSKETPNLNTPRSAASRDPTDQRPSPSRPGPNKRPQPTAIENHDARAELGTSGEISSQKRAGSGSPVDRSVPQQNGNPRTANPPKEHLTGRVTPTTEVTIAPSLNQAVGSSGSDRSIETEPGPSTLQLNSSPGRSARFSNRLSVTGLDQLHHPPPRSVSPVKSAMKQSNSPKGSLSPERRVGVVVRPGPALSEISDGTSVASDEGSRLGVRRKPVKVSFDDEAEIVGVAASPPTSPEEMSPESPPGKFKAKNNWFGVAKRKPLLLDNSGMDDFDEVLKPRPALPSFGSIRGARDTEQQGVIKEEPSDNESTASSSSNMVVPGWSLSNDHAIGGILSRAQSEDVEERKDLDHAPLPAVNETPNAPSYAEKLKENLPAEPTPQTLVVESVPGLGTNPNSDVKEEVATTADSKPSIPAIAVQPATPGIEKERSSLEIYTVPGGFPRSSMEFDPKASGKKKGKKSHERSGSGTSVSFDESGMSVPNANHSDEDSGDSIYSDAAEDMEGDGFGSINAIVDSRQAAGADPFIATNGPTEVASNGIMPDKPDATDDTDQIGRAVTPAQGAAIPDVADSPESPKMPLPFSSPYPPFPVNNKGGVARSNTTSKKAGRPVSVAAPREPLPQATQGPGQERKKRPVSMGPVFHKTKDVGFDDAGPRMNGRRANSLARPTSSGSDSSSSFKRTNRSPKGDSPHAMRRTMRGNAQSSQIQSPSHSPTLPTERRPMSSGSTSSKAMRTTLRGNGLQNGKASFFTTGKPPRTKIAKAPTTVCSLSRFADSDDEDGGNQSRNFRSRFVDSSDEEGPATSNLRPVRGIPRRQGAHDGDSTELEDSSDEDKRQGAPSTPAKKQNGTGPTGTSPLAAVAKSRGVSEQELEEFLHQPNRGRVSGFFSRLSIKKPKNSDHRIRRSTLESPSRRDTPLERSRQELDQIREEPLGTVTTVTSDNVDNNHSPSPSKLLRKGSRRAGPGEKWPLEQDSKDSEAAKTNGVPLANRQPERPRTADGVLRNESAMVNGTSNGNGTAAKEPESPHARSNGEGSHFGNRNSTALDVIIEPSGRKKRFPMLRKAFGLRN